MPFVAAESLVRGWLAGHFGSGYRFVTEVPADLATVLAATPIGVVTRFGGSDVLPVLDAANIDVDTYGLTREAARDFGEQVRAALLFLMPGQSTGGGFVAAASTINAPRWVPYDNTNVRRFVASYRITIRSVPSEGVPA